MLILLVYSGLAMALDGYVVVPSPGGHCTNPDGSEGNCSITANGYDCSAYGGSPYGGPINGPATVEGPLRFTLQWQSDSGAPAPVRVVVQRHVVASSQCYSVYGPIQVQGGVFVAESGLGKTSSGSQFAHIEESVYTLMPGGQTLTVPTFAPFAKGGFASTTPPYPSALHARVTAGVAVYTPLEIVVHVHVTAADSPGQTQVAGLKYNTIRHQQEGGFIVSASAMLPNNQSVPPDCILQYQWSDANGNLQFDDASAQSTAAHTTGPKVCFPVCKVIAIRNGSPAYAGESSNECAAIGGPINVGLKTQPNTYQHDQNDPTKSWYLTVFDYNNIGFTPSLSQPTQYLTLNVLKGQPEGTTVTYGDIPMTYKKMAGRVGLAGIFACNVYAQGAFRDAVPTAHFHFQDNAISGDADDDSATTMDPVEDPITHKVSYVAHVYKLSGHKPTSLVECNDASVRPLSGAPNDLALLDPTFNPEQVPPPSLATNWTNGQLYRYTLLDDTGDRMPGIWVQERFTDMNQFPPNGSYNSVDDYWPTLLLSPLNRTISSSFTTSLPNVDSRDGLFGGARTDGNGKPKVYDRLQYTWIVGDSTVYVFSHVYLAGTRASSLTATAGVPLGTCTITLTPGTPGTARQSP